MKVPFYYRSMQSWRDERKIPYLLIIAIALTILELYTSFRGLQRGFTEGNPVMRYVLTNLGLVGFLFVNVVLSSLLLAFLAWGSMEKLEGEWKYMPIGVYCLLRGIMVVNNILILLF